MAGMKEHSNMGNLLIKLSELTKPLFEAELIGFLREISLPNYIEQYLVQDIEANNREFERVVQNRSTFYQRVLCLLITKVI